MDKKFRVLALALGLLYASSLAAQEDGVYMHSQEVEDLAGMAFGVGFATGFAVVKESHEPTAPRSFCWRLQKATLDVAGEGSEALKNSQDSSRAFYHAFGKSMDLRDEMVETLLRLDCKEYYLQ